MPTPWTSLRTARKAAGLTQAALGARIGTSETMIRHLEAGRKGVSVGRLRDLAEALDVTPADLVLDACA